MPPIRTGHGKFGGPCSGLRSLCSMLRKIADFCPCCKSCDHDGWTGDDEDHIEFGRLEPCFQCCPCGPSPPKEQMERDEGIIIAKENPMFQPSSFHQHYPQPYAGPTQPQMQQAPYPYPQQNNGQGYYTLNGNGALQPPPYSRRHTRTPPPLFHRPRRSHPESKVHGACITVMAR